MRFRKALSATALAAALALVLLLIAGCGGGGEGGGATGGDAATKPAVGGKATAAQAYSDCRAEVEKLVSSGGRLSQVVGRNVDLEGKAESWEFIVLGPEKEGTSISEHHIAWNRGKLETGLYQAETLGYEGSPRYSYLFHAIEEGWLDSPRIAEAYVKRYPDKGITETLDMRLQYYDDPSLGIEGTVWNVVWELNKTRALFDAASGEFLGEVT
ncbi:MAG: hypothetical protein ACUVRX_10270 [Actinomycetota bacterium]